MWLFAACILLFGPGPGAAREASLASTDTPTPTSDAERVRALVRVELGDDVLVDPALDAAAELLAGRALDGRTDRAAVRDLLWHQGIRDFEFLPITTAGSAAPPDLALEPLLRDPAVDWSRFDRVGVGLRERGGRVGLAILLTRRGARFVEGGKPAKQRVELPDGRRAPTLFVSTPSGQVVRRPVAEARDGRYEFDARPGGNTGLWLFELVAESPTGPEVLALWAERVEDGTLSVRTDADLAPYAERTGVGLDDDAPDPMPVDVAPWVLGTGVAPDRSPTPEDALAAEDHLWRLIQATRQARGLPTYARDPALTRAARAHAADIARGEPFGHVTSSGTAMTRLEREGLTALRAAENVARVDSPSEAHAAFLGSPAHRAVLLDDGLQAGGVGVVLTREASGRWAASISEVFAKLVERADPAAFAQEALAGINERRVRAGLKPLDTRLKLDELALEASAERIRAGRTDLPPERRKALAEEVRFHYFNARRVGVDFLVTPDVGTVQRIAHAIDPDFVELGLGIVRTDESFEGHAAGSFVVTLLFVQR